MMMEMIGVMGDFVLLSMKSGEIPTAEILEVMVVKPEAV